MNTRDTLYVKDGSLMIGSFKATELAAKFGTPLYVMDAQYIAEVCDAFVAAVNKCGSGAVAFANKAFATVATAKLAAAHGLWFDVVSGGELYLVAQAGADMKKVLFHGNNKTPREIDEGLAHGIGFFVVDSLNELELLDEKAGKRGVKQDVLVRVNPGVSAHTYEAVMTAAPFSKFGFDVHGDALDVIKDIASRKNLNFRGLHVHIGSQIYDHSSYDAAIDITTDFVKKLADEGIVTDILDMGGGYGIYYTDEDPKFTPRRYAYTVESIARLVAEKSAEKGLKQPFLIVEPGRSIVGEAGITLYTVGAIKDFPGVRKYVAVDGGMFDNPRYALYESRYSAVIANKADKPADEIVTIAGKCCESGDLIGKDMPLQHAETGDILAVFSTGAYNYSMASNYNLNAVPPVVLVDGDKADYIVKPQTYGDLLRNNTVPEWLNG